MIRKIVYIFLAILLLLVFLWWFFLSHVSFCNFADEEWIYRENEYYIAKTYHPKLINPFGLYFHVMKESPTYVVLFDKNGKYIGQSSPFFIDDGIAIQGGLFSRKNLVFYGTEADEYDIPIDHKKWWSYILQYFH